MNALLIPGISCDLSSLSAAIKRIPTKLCGTLFKFFEIFSSVTLRSVLCARLVGTLRAEYATHNHKNPNTENSLVGKVQSTNTIQSCISITVLIPMSP